MIKGQMQKVSLVEGITGLTKLQRMSQTLGIELYIKRDDNTGFALGGNKARKLEYIFGQVILSGADTVITTGGSQSNHARMTAAAAAKLGLRCIVLLIGQPPKEVQGNLLLDQIFGADVRYAQFKNLTQYFSEIDHQLEEIAQEVALTGGRPYVIPVGGAAPEGALGYVDAVGELVNQMKEKGIRLETIVHPSGTGGTQAGILLGSKLYGLQARVIGIGVGKDKPVLEQHITDLCPQAAGLLNIQLPVHPKEVVVYDEFLGADYGLPTEEGMEAVYLLAQQEGILLDPIYTGKAMAGLIELTKRGEIRSGEKVLFWHTGGCPAIFAYHHAFV